MRSKKLTIGLFGFGVVGEGIYKVLRDTPSLEAAIKKVCIKHPEKIRDAPAAIFTTHAEELLNDPTINLIVELIDNSEEAFVIVSEALRRRKAVVSANKKMIAEHFTQLRHLQNEYGTALLYEAAVCVSIPVIRNLEEYYDNDLLKSICGVVNGSTNFILTRIIDDKLTYAEALRLAQQAGFAESNPALDVNGIDAANKLSILLLHGYGLRVAPGELLCKGITSIHADDATFSGEKGYRIRLCARAFKLANGTVGAFVLPHFVTTESQLYNVVNEYNGVVIETGLADKQFLFGKGAGRYPTSSAVLSDIAALRYDYRYEYRKLSMMKQRDGVGAADDFYLRVYVSFNDWSIVNRDAFAWIDEFHGTGDRQYICGVIHYRTLRDAEWFHFKDVSVIVLPDGIAEPSVTDSRAIQQKSLRLAGIY
ncbi:MAG: homoserine dehydrogenase [Chitinophagaceae bacterium]